jgi:hypothetical protein
MWAGGLVVVGSGPRRHTAAIVYPERSDKKIPVMRGDTDQSHESPPLSKDFLQQKPRKTTLLFHDVQFYDDQAIKLPLVIQCVPNTEWPATRARGHIDTEHIEANYDAGVLRLRIPVAEQAKPRKISTGSTNSAAVSAWFG